jgi:hypothetical protein
MMCTCVRSAQVWSQRQEDSCGSVQRVLQQVSCGWTGHSEFACTRLCSHQLAQTLSVCVTHCLARLSWPKTRHPPRVRTRSHSTVPQQHTTPPHLNCCSSHACSPRPPCTLTFLALSHNHSPVCLPASFSCDQSGPALRWWVWWRWRGWRVEQQRRKLHRRVAGRQAVGRRNGECRPRRLRSSWWWWVQRGCVLDQRSRGVDQSSSLRQACCLCVNNPSRRHFKHQQCHPCVRASGQCCCAASRCRGQRNDGSERSSCVC